MLALVLALMRSSCSCSRLRRACLKLVPHTRFTFAKVWVLAAKFEVRQGRLDAARKILGTALGLCPKPKLFKAYIELEMAMGAVDRYGQADRQQRPGGGSCRLVDVLDTNYWMCKMRWTCTGYVLDVYWIC